MIVEIFQGIIEARHYTRSPLKINRFQLGFNAMKQYKLELGEISPHYGCWGIKAEGLPEKFMDIPVEYIENNPDAVLFDLSLPV